jgi:beta-lactamase regulating signal transducer with metallopeptidase domain/protocatechuate 3,4-dioxygenase beta subunit
MAWHLGALTWLAHAAVGGSLFLAAGCLAVALCRQPVRRILLIELALAGALLVPWAAALPGLPHWSVGWLELAGPPADPPAVPEAPPPQPAPLTNARPPVVTDQLPSASAAAPPLPAVEVAPAPAPAVASVPEAPPRRPSPATLALAAYAGLAGLFLAGALLGLVRLVWLCRSAHPVPRHVRDLFRLIAGPSGEHVRLLASDRIELPLMFAAWRPVVLLPDELCRADDREPLAYCLAHEWSHVERRDAWRWYLATAAQIVFFYQPLFWWLRRQLRLCQDYLADARAAALAPAAEEYAAYLVTLARRRLAGPVAALGIGDRHSSLYRRVLMLLHTREPLQRRCVPGWSACAVLGAAALLAALSAFRLDARAADKAAPKPPANEGTKNNAAKGETLHYTGTVVDKDTGKPLAGAAVTVRRSLAGDPKLEPNNPVLQETRHTTDAAGKYSFTIPPEQSSQRYLYIELDVERPDYAPQKNFGYALGMIRKNEKMGGRPFFERVELRPGKAITGTVQTPNGKPVAGVKVLAYSRTDKRGEQFEYGSFADTHTDAAGKFRLVVTTPGQAVFWLLPEDYVPTAHAVPAGKRGDMGTFTVHEGVRLHGKVLDTKGRPLAGVLVNAQKRGQSEELQGMPVADQIARGAQTDAKGEFTMRPLPPGEYEVKPDSYSREPSKSDRIRKPVPAVFLDTKVVIKAGAEPEALEIRAVPHVVVEAQYLDGKGKATRGHAPFLFGQMGRRSYFIDAKADVNGKVTAVAPHGLEHARLQLMTNEHGSLRWRKAKGEPLSNAHEIDLGTLNDDVKGIEIIRYTAPLVLVRVKAADGTELKGAAVTALYGKGKGPYQGRLIVAAGRNSDISFEHQEDGRFRSEQLLPDEDTAVTAHADGYTSKSVTVKLPEGDRKEIEIVLDKAPPKK